MIVDSLFAILYEFIAICIQCMYMGYTVLDYQPGNLGKHANVSTVMHRSSSGQKKPHFINIFASDMEVAPRSSYGNMRVHV